MKKFGGIAIIALVFISIFLLYFACAATNTSTNTSTSTTSTSSNTNVGIQQNQSKINLGFECLEDKVDDCSDLSIKEIAFTILASPKTSVLDDCINELKDREKSKDCWGEGDCNPLETALAIIALSRVGENTDEAENWLIKQNQTPTELLWYLEQDSNEAAQCKISYDGDDYTLDVTETKKLSSNAGSCLTRAFSNYWLKISPSCYDEEFAISCDKDFIATLLYKDKDTNAFNILEDTESKPAYGTINLKIKSRCFASTGDSCNYEATAWATLALQETGHEVEEYIPYLIAMADSNKGLLPNAFIYLATDFEDYGSKLIKDQELGNYWQADFSVNGKYYDTALALIALRSSSSEQVIKARDWALFSQSADGCWKDSVLDTAIMLWALAGRSPGHSTGGGVTTCSEGNYFCIPSADCPAGEKLNNYWCAGLSTVCCQSENLLTCDEYNGQVCASDKVCVGNERKSSNQNKCCIGSCEDAPVTTECEDVGYICRDECSTNQEQITYDCNTPQVCCRTKTTPTSGSSWWIWLLFILILVVIIALGWIYREKLKLWWFKIRSKFKKDKGNGSNARPTTSFPPRPGFPPIRRMPQQMQRSMPTKSYQGDKALDETFRKLREMSR